MTKILKRPLSILLAVLMIAGVFAALPLTAYAATYESGSVSISNLTEGDILKSGVTVTAVDGTDGFRVFINTDEEVIDEPVQSYTTDKNYSVIAAMNTDDGGDNWIIDLKPIAHTHSFTYTASGATITATCEGSGTCDITDGLTLTISAPTGDLTADGTTTFPATLNDDYNTTAFPGTYTIVYTKDGQPYDGTPTEAGDYTASVTVGTATASVSYTATAAVQEQSESFITKGYSHYDDWWESDIADPINGTNVTITPEDGMYSVDNGWSPTSSEKIYFSVKNENIIRKIQITTDRVNGVGTCIAGKRQITGVINKVNDNTFVITYDKVNASSAYVSGITDAPQITVYYSDAYIPVTWKNGDAVIGTDYYVMGETPTYTGTVPVKAEDADYAYTFSGWTDGTNTYGATDTLPKVTGDITYTATFTASAAVGDIVPEDEYLTFTAEEAGSSVTLRYTNGTLKYNKNNSVWEDYTKGAQIMLENEGDYVRFRGKDIKFNVFNHVSIGGKVACSGNVMSLRLNDYGRNKGLSGDCFDYMFYECAGLTAAPELPETTLAEGCYTSMFQGCTSLTTAPELPATTLELGCYSYMFYGCSSLTALPALPATTLVRSCYCRMFEGCSSIKLSETQTAEYCIPYRVPSVGNVTTTPQYALLSMFAGTGGTFAGTPAINTTYYLYREVPKDLFPQHSITLGGDIGVNFYIDSAAADFANAETAVVKFTWDNGNYHEEVDLKALTPDTSTGYYKATVDVVAAHMAHEIHAEVYLDGEKLDQTDDYSVKEYAETVYANPEAYDTKGKPDELKALVKALLNYGANAQTVFATSLNEHPALANKTVGNNGYEAVTAEQIGEAINGDASDLNAIATQLGANYYTNSLIYLSKNTLRIYFTPTSYPGEIPNASAYDGNLSGYYYYVDHANIPAAELDNQQTFTVGGTTFTFSALDYAKAVVESTKMEPEQQNLAKALYLYNQAANDYFDVAHDHTPGEPVHVSGTPATCSAAGSYYEVTYCTKCGEEVSRVAKTIDKLAHTPGAAVQENVVPASCSATGSYDEVVYCSECHEELSREQKTIDKLAHTPGEPVQEKVVPATCTAAGSYDKVVYCTECNAELSREAKTIDKLAHTITEVAEVAATTEATGVKAHYECSVCHKLFTDAEGTTETTAEELVIPMLKILNLGDVKENTTVEDGYIVTGTLKGNYKISIADGATVTLKDANITCLSSSAKYAGITPLGDATIMLEGANTVKGGYEEYPGVYVPVGKTLTIDGDGSLTASSNGSGCGIGGGYRIAAGNIVINGGTINATGGYQAAGIGSGFYNSSCSDITINGGIINATGGDYAAGIGSGDGDLGGSSCGDITINGGTITANGGERAAGIGSGNEATCGNIMIADTVTQVTATKGIDAPDSIGRGYGGTCGTVTIGGVVKGSITNSPYTYQP